MAEKQLNKQESSLSLHGDRSLVLGIDLGTTSVKVCIIDARTHKCVKQLTKDTQANVPSELGSEGNKQYVPKIVSALHTCISRLPREALRRVEKVGVCGQMHGCVLWKAGQRLEPQARHQHVRDGQVSHLYTWQDTRCSPEFLASLPAPDSHLGVHSGYGVATLLWFLRHKPQKLDMYDRSGTIQDLVVAMLCELDTPVMSVQNAASWGYFNTTTGSWNTELLKEAGLPLHLLPPDRAVLNVSTSAQMALLLPHGFEPPPASEAGCVSYLPYLDGRYLAVAAALTGGNALAAFVQMLQRWTQELGFNVPQSAVWTKILALAEAPAPAAGECELRVVPTVRGERHAPHQRASVTGVDVGNTGLGQVTDAVCRGVAANMDSMMSREWLLARGVRRLVGTGSALARNGPLRRAFQLTYDTPLEMADETSAAYGAALAAARCL
ncbi:LOW QUALITY PROTEIN: sedoheptulokinase-like [Pollicipes pollicipes]|uniref:LOW QUALITY PROTEIN: sedoheptulokinase-like n=1 Tax=Pollicipes pollicipes TaxID=41117 RepID=UPI001884E119|nr:LOW QUALITY PROTEIN: sedoheptulokinase-like [Pollicipes pollicipes]